MPPITPSGRGAGGRGINEEGDERTTPLPLRITAGRGGRGIEKGSAKRKTATPTLVRGSTTGNFFLHRGSRGGGASGFLTTPLLTPESIGLARPPAATLESPESLILPAPSTGEHALSGASRFLATPLLTPESLGFSRPPTSSIESSPTSSVGQH